MTAHADPTQRQKSPAGIPKGTENYDPELIAILENKRLKLELKTAQEESDILKKATAYFAKFSK